VQENDFVSAVNGHRVHETPSEGDRRGVVDRTSHGKKLTCARTPALHSENSAFSGAGNE